jgi:hypothetical protein
MTTELSTSPFPFLDRDEERAPVSVSLREDPPLGVSPLAFSVPPPKPSASRMLASLPVRFGR